jgi:hypothetical protein
VVEGLDLLGTGNGIICVVMGVEDD